MATQRQTAEVDDARPRLTNRPIRTRGELEDRVWQALEKCRSVFARVATPFVVEPGDGRSRYREWVRTESDMGKVPRPHGLYALSIREHEHFVDALCYMTYSQLWWTLYLFDETKQNERYATQHVKQAQVQVRAAMGKLEAFTKSVANEIQNDEQRRVFDAREELLVNLAARNLLNLEIAEAQLVNVKDETTRTMVSRRRLAGSRLRAALPGSQFTWGRIGELIYASVRMFPIPSPVFVKRCIDEQVDLPGLLKKDAQRDISRSRTERQP